MHNNKLITPLLVAGLLIAGGTAYAAGTLPPASKKKDVTFATDIKPLFEASCVKCHGAQRPKAGLRLDTLEGVLAGGKEGKVLVVGDSAKSDIVTAVARIDPETAMPPERRAPRGPGGPGGPAGGAAPEKKPAAAAHDTGTHAPAGNTNHPPSGPGGPGRPGQGPAPKPLTPEEVGLVRAWIDQGAK